MHVSQTTVVDLVYPALGDRNDAISAHVQRLAMLEHASKNHF